MKQIKYQGTDAELTIEGTGKGMCAPSWQYHGMLPVSPPRRNDPCPCGSGIKYKKCCINGDVQIGMEPVDMSLPFVVPLANQQMMIYSAEQIQRMVASAKNGSRFCGYVVKDGVLYRPRGIV